MIFDKENLYFYSSCVLCLPPHLRDKVTTILILYSVIALPQHWWLHDTKILSHSLTPHINTWDFNKGKICKNYVLHNVLCNKTEYLIIQRSASKKAPKGDCIAKHDQTETPTDSLLKLITTAMQHIMPNVMSWVQWLITAEATEASQLSL